MSMEKICTKCKIKKDYSMFDNQKSNPTGKHSRCMECRRIDRGARNEANKIKYNGLHAIWEGMKSRCNGSNKQKLKHYYQKGIRVCDDWMDFQNFYEWAIGNGYCKGLYIDRIDNSKGYESSNCRFVTPKESCRNQTNNKLTKELVAEIREAKLNGTSAKTIASNYGISESYVYKLSKHESYWE